MIKIAKYQLPDFTASYFVNGDDSGLEQEDIDAIQLFEKEMISHHGIFCCMGCDNDEQPEFTYYHDLRGYGIGAADSIVFSFQVEKNEDCS